jgi:hypothetical protein
MKIFIIVDYISDNVLIYFHNFLKLKIMIFNFFKNRENTGAWEPKALFANILLCGNSRTSYIYTIGA